MDIFSSDDRELREVSVGGSQVFRGQLLDVRVDRVLLPGGGISTREYVRHQGAVVVIPILENGQLVFERQFRYPVGKVVVEFPAGKIDSGESAVEAARRELLEETGFVAREWRGLGVLYPCVGYSNEMIEIFLARGLIGGGCQKLDQGEKLEVFSMSLDEAIEGVRSGRVCDAKTVAAIFWIEKVFLNGW